MVKKSSVLLTVILSRKTKAENILNGKQYEPETGMLEQIVRKDSKINKDNR